MEQGIPEMRAYIVGACPGIMDRAQVVNSRAAALRDFGGLLGRLSFPGRFPPECASMIGGGSHLGASRDCSLAHSPCS
jgi:hypothetical protein